jgi:uncharacterized membrane protein YwaF
MTRMKIRKVGLWSSIAAFVAFGLTGIAHNGNLGFGYSIARRDQLGLVAAAITLCALQLVLYLVAHRKENNAKGDKRS